MGKIFGKIITFIISLLMIIIFLVTIYFCLDAFKVIKVPEKYSIASLLYKKIDDMASGIDVEGAIQVDDINKERIIVREGENTTETSSPDVENPLNLLQNMQSANNSANNSNNNSSSNSSSSQNAIATNRFYYSQLDEYGKRIYDRLYNHREDLKTGTYTVDYEMIFNDLLQTEDGENILKEALDSATNSLILDNPDIFYVDISKMYLLTHITTKLFSTTYKVSIGGNNGNSYLEGEFNSIEDVKIAEDKIKEEKKKIIEQTRGLDRVKQIEFIHDYLIDNTEYNADAGDSVYSIYGTLINKQAVCEGYAKAFKSLLDELEIPCIIVCGTGTNSVGLTESHAWNYVFINNKWYAVDVTWDDPIINGFLPGALPKDIRYSNFLKGSNEFFKSHVEDDYLLGHLKLNYPEVSLEDY